MRYQRFNAEASSHALQEVAQRAAHYRCPGRTDILARLKVPSVFHRSDARSVGLSITQRALFFLVIVQSALLPLVPDEWNIQSIGFAATFAMLWIVSLGNATIATTARWAGIALGMFFISVFFSYPIAVTNGIPSAEWLRGCVPFSFLSTFFVLGTAKGEEDSLFILDSLQIAALCWAVKILVVSAGDVNSLLSGAIARLTYVTLDTLIPFGFLGFILSLYNPSSFASRFRAGFIALFGVLVFACAYRSQIVLCAAATVAHPQIYRRLPVVGLAVLLLIVPFGAVVSWSESSMLSNIAARFERVSEIRTFDDMGTRAHELRSALSLFLASPIYGNGLGCPVPGVYTGESDYYRSIHNVWFYLLMDLGLIGCGSYVLFVIASLWRHGENRAHPRLNEYVRARRCAKIVMGVLLLYTSCQAAYRGIQFNLMLAAAAVVATAPFSPKFGSMPTVARETR